MYDRINQEKVQTFMQMLRMNAEKFKMRGQDAVSKEEEERRIQKDRFEGRINFRQYYKKRNAYYSLTTFLEQFNSI